MVVHLLKSLKRLLIIVYVQAAEIESRMVKVFENCRKPIFNLSPEKMMFLKKIDQEQDLLKELK